MALASPPLAAHSTTSHHDLANFIWGVADLLRGPYRPPQYERVMLPFTVLRRFDCVLETNRSAVVAENLRLKEKYPDPKFESYIEKQLKKVADEAFYNTSPLSFSRLLGDSPNIAAHLGDYINGFSANVRRIFEFFDFGKEIETLDSTNRLYQVVREFCRVDLHPDRVDNLRMGLLFEDLIRRFNEQANETAGDHFTPREVIELMVELLFAPDDELLARPGRVCKICDPACGTGGMLAVAQNYLREHNSAAKPLVYGQDYNKRSYAIAASDLLIKGQSDAKIEYGDTLVNDQFEGETFDYLLANPPYGVDWKTQQSEIKKEHERRGFSGRFGAGLPRVNDGSLLFLQHMISKFEPFAPAEKQFGTRIGIVFNGSPLFSGGAGSGESEIRKWIIEQDWLEAVVALPEQMFYNTGIGTYIWVVCNRKSPARRGKVQLIDGRERWQSLRRSLGNKRREIGPEDIAATVSDYSSMAEHQESKVFSNSEFGFSRLTVERPLRLRFAMTSAAIEGFIGAHPSCSDAIWVLREEFGEGARLDWNDVWEQVSRILKGFPKWSASQQKDFRSAFCEIAPDAEPVWKDERKGLYEADSGLRDSENVPLCEDIDEWFAREVTPHVPDAWIDHDKTKIGYEVAFNRYFSSVKPSRPLEEIDAELQDSERRILELLSEVTR